MTKTITGKLVNVSGRFYYFVEEDGDEFRIHFEGDGTLPPVEVPILLRVSDEPTYADGGYEVNTDEYPFWHYAQTDHAAGAPLSKVYLALYWQHRPGSDKQSALATAQKWADELTRFLLKYTPDHWEIEVRPFLYEGTCNPVPPSYCATDIGQKVDLGDYKPTHHQVVSYFSNEGYCGLGNINGTRSAVYLYGQTCNVHTAIHELLHNIGLHHANDHEDGEYKDLSCVMGQGPKIPGLNAPHVREARWIGPDGEIVVNDSASFYLAPVEVHDHALIANEYRIAVLERDNSPKWTLSLRKDAGWPWNPKGTAARLFLHYLEEGKTWYWKDIGPGTLIALPNQVEVFYTAHDPLIERAAIEIRYPQRPDPQKISLPVFGFYPALPDSGPKPEHTGLWHDRRADGQGFDLTVKNGWVSLYWYTYNADAPDRRFYFASGPVTADNSALELDLHTTAGGTFTDPTLAKVANIGKVRIWFESGNLGTVDFATTEHGRGCIEIQRLSIGSPVSGLWYDPLFWGSGYSIQHIANENRAVAFWYTYGPTRTNAALRNERQRWYMIDLDNPTPVLDLKAPTVSEFTGLIYELPEGRFNAYGAMQINPVGRATLSYQKDGTALMAYELDAPDNKGSSKHRLKRLI